jgi:serine protease Do
MFSITVVSQVESQPIFREGLPEFAHVKSREPAPAFPQLSGLIKVLSPAVVNITVEGVTEGEAQLKDLPFFRREPDPQMKSLGSGFIVHEDGYIVTNNHVIDGASRIIIRLLDDKNEYTATVIGVDPKTDLALIKIDAGRKLETVYLGNSDSVEVGDWVVAIGNQFQLGQTVTAGIVSAKSRRVPAGNSGPYDAFIQTDASINPGSSGGPLFNTEGQVIGVNTAIFSPGRTHTGNPGFNIGIGFAIPVNLVKSIIPQLKEQGKVVRGLLGVKIQPVTNDLKEVLQLEGQSGALVADVMSGTPAFAAGFKKKDVILKYNGKDIKEYEDLPLMVANTAVGSRVEVVVMRDAKMLTFNVEIREFNEPQVQVSFKQETPNEIGLVTEELTEEKLQQLGLDLPAGLIVTKVEGGSVGEQAGFQAGDIIEEIAGTSPRTEDELSKVISGFKKNIPVLVMVRRNDGTRILTIKIH